MIQIENFNVRVVRKGDHYGRNDCLEHDEDEPLVEFYDAKWTKFGPRGQFVSRYYLETIMETPTEHGLALDCGVPEWSISKVGMKQVRAYLKGFADALEVWV